MVRHPQALQRQICESNDRPCTEDPEAFQSVIASLIITIPTYIHESPGLIAASLRMMNHSTLVIPINGPSRLLAAPVR